MDRYEVIAPTLMAGRYLVPKVHMPDGGFRGLSIVDIEVDNGRVYAVSIMPFSEEIPHTVQIDTPLHLRPLH